MERNAKHATVRTSIFDEDRFTYAVNQRVMTVDSFPGVITARQAGPMPGSESYTVHLDDGMGGGEYRIDDITPLADEIAATARRYSDVPLVCDKCGCTATTSMSGGKDGHTMLCPDCQAARKTAGYGDVSQKITEGNLTFEVWQNYDRDTYSERFPLFTWKGEYVCTVTSWSDEGATKGYGSEIIDGYGDSPEAALADARRQLSTFMKASRTVVNGGERTAARANLPLAAPGSLHVASDDYPELEDILWTRPDHVEAMPTGVRTLGSTTATTIKDTINDPNSSWLYRHVTGPAIDRMNDALPGTYRVDDITQVRGDLNWCRFRRDSHCFFPKALDEQATRVAGYDVWVPVDRGPCKRHLAQAQKDCEIAEPGPKSGEANWKPDATKRWDQGGQRVSVRMTARTASDDGYEMTHRPASISNPKMGAWTNVRDKGVEIRRNGGVHIIANTGNTVTAEVHGDHNIYVTTITRVPGSKEQGLWQCSCPWSTYAWGRSEPWKSLEGRQCSHAYALLMEMQAQEMFGGHIEESRDTPSWRTTEPVMSSLSAQDVLLSLGNIADSLIVASGIMEDDDGRLRMEAALDATRSVADRIADAGARQSSSRQAGAFPAKVRGRVTQVEVTPAGVLADGEPVSAGEVLYPTWDPSAGLAYFGAKTADWNWQLPSAPVVKPTDGVDGRFTVTVENYVVGWLWKTERSWDAFMVDPSSATGEVVGRGFTSKAAALSSLVSSLENSYKRFERIKARDDAHADEMRQLFGAKAAVSDGATRQFGSYTMRYHTEDQGERKPRHVIEAFDGGTKVGELNWYGTTGTVHHIGVEDGFLRQGVATAMWEWGQEMSPKPKHSADRTTQGDAWARSVGGPVPRSASVKTATDYDEIDAMWNANYWSGQADVARRQQAAQQRLYDMKGQEVTVVKGRKIPIGTKGIVFYVGEGQWGWRVGFNDASGNAVWTDVSNVKLTSELSSAASLHIAGVGVIEDVSSIDDLPTDGFGYAGLIIKSIDSGRVLLTQRSPFHGDDEKSFGKWEFPGGHLDDGETPFEGALREFTEETGLSLPENWEVRGYCPSGKYLGIVLAVPHEAWTVDASLLDFETMGLGWFDLDDVDGASFVRAEVQSTDFEMVREAAGPIGPGPLPLGMRICPDCGGEGCLLIEPLFDGNVGDTDTCNLCAGKGYIRDTRPGVEIDFERRHIEGELTPEAMGVARNEARYDSENGEGTLAILHDEPQPALPEALGSDAPFVPGDPRLSHLAPAGGEGEGNEDIAAAAQAILKSALKTFSPAEQQRIIDEGAHMSLGASNTDRLDLAGTFYETLEHEDDPIGFW